MLNDPYFKRSYVVGGIAVVIVLIYIIRLFVLQVVDQTTGQQADKNALLRQTVYPSRGLIYDRNDTLLVYNQPIYEVMLIKREMGRDFDTLRFCERLKMTRAEFDERMAQVTDRKRNRSYSPYTPQVFLSQLTMEDVSPLQEMLFHFPGVSIRKRTLRDYRYNLAAHLLGSVGEVNQRDLDNDDYYQAGDYSGRDGIERRYEKQLRGEKGVEILMRDSKGRIQGPYHNGEDDRLPVSGQNLTLSIDIRLQRLAEELMHGKMGSVVALEPATGEVLALVSVPAWDPKTLVGRQRSANYGALLNDEHKPLMNRATQAEYPPGSTFKLLQALVGLQERSITPATEYGCSGPQSTPIKCTHHHGSPVSLEAAIEQSCNPYFWCAFRDLLQKRGVGSNELHEMYDRWWQDITSFGFGHKFDDSDISDQRGGSIPSAKLYDRLYGTTGWKAITIRSLSIGQGEILVTPLQLANQAACIANGGWYYAPHLLHNDTTQREKHYTRVDARWFPVVQTGMHRVMTNGTGRWYNIDTLQMCGKTGTVQNPHGKDHAIFIGFAPQDDPKIAVAVVVENAGFGATWACPVASLMIEKYLTDTITRPALYHKMADAVLIKQEE